MSTFISLLLIIFALFNTYCMFMIRQLRASLKRIFTSTYEIQHPNFKILHELSNSNPLLREYVVYNAPIFAYPFAAGTISALNSFIQIMSALIFIYSIIKFNVIFLVSTVVLFFLSGYSGSRFNKKAMFNEAILNFSKKVPPYNRDYFVTVLNEFHEQYLEKLAEKKLPYSSATTDELSGNHEKIIETCNEKIKKDPQDITSYNAKGAVLYKLGNYEEAIKVFDEAINVNPADPKAHNFKGLAFIKQGRYAEAITIFDEIISMDSNNYRAYCDKALALSEIGRHEEAVNSLDKAIKINPQNTEAYFNKGVNLGKLDRYEAAAHMFNEVLKIDPKDTEANNYKSLMLEKLNG